MRSLSDDYWLDAPGTVGGLRINPCSERAFATRFKNLRNHQRKARELTQTSPHSFHRISLSDQRLRRDSHRRNISACRSSSAEPH